MKKKLHERHNWTNRFDFIKNKNIFEYDIVDAGFSMIQHYKLLPEDKIAEIKKISNKLSKNVFIGRLIANDYKLGAKMLDSFKLIRKSFFELNELTEEHIVSIKKDAIFTTKRCKKLKINSFTTFKEKNKYTSYYNLSGIEFYYNRTSLDIKGASKSFNKECELITDLKEIFRLNELSNNKIVLDKLINIREKYLFGEYGVDSYKEINSGRFKLDMKVGLSSIFVDSLTDELKEEIDNSTNFMELIIPLIQLIV